VEGLFLLTLARLQNEGGTVFTQQLAQGTTLFVESGVQEGLHTKVVALARDIRADGILYLDSTGPQLISIAGEVQHDGLHIEVRTCIPAWAANEGELGPWLDALGARLQIQRFLAGCARVFPPRCPALACDLVTRREFSDGTTLIVTPMDPLHFLVALKARGITYDELDADAQRLQHCVTFSFPSTLGGPALELWQGWEQCGTERDRQRLFDGFTAMLCGTPATIAAS
jgi:hypothetical protein